jgi:membrane protein DedA with SNARE-associated domain
LAELDGIGRSLEDWAPQYERFAADYRRLLAGASDLEYPRFAVFAYAGAFTWVGCFLSIGYFVGDQWARASEQFHHYIVISSIAIGVILGLYLLVRRISNSRRS